MTNRIVTLVLSSFLSLAAFGAISPYISPDGTRANIVIQGPDTDALELYNLMLLEPSLNSNGTSQKEIISSSGQLKIRCNYSELINQASCTVTIHQGATSTLIDSIGKVVFIEFWGAEGDEISEKFEKLGSEQHFTQYVTEKQELALLGKKDNFSLQYTNIE